MTHLLIAGCTRSGTTLLSRALNRHSNIFVAPETHFYTKVWSQRRMVRPMAGRPHAEKVADLLARNEYPDLGIFRESRAAIVNALCATPEPDDQFFAILDALSAAAVRAEKTPWHTLLIDQILRDRCDARLLGIVRHPAATVASVMGKPGFRRVATVLQCSARWCLMNRALLLSTARLGTKRAKIIRYEDLVSDPASVLRDVCHFLGIAYDSRVEAPDFSDSSHRLVQVENTSFDASRTDLWRDVLSSEQQDEILSLTGKLARTFGYDTGDRKASSWARLKLESEIALQSAGVQLMRWGVYPLGGLIGPESAGTNAARRPSRA